MVLFLIRESHSSVTGPVSRSEGQLRVSTVKNKKVPPNFNS